MKVGLVVYPGFEAMSLAVTSVLEIANLSARREVYSTEILSEQGGAVRCSAGFLVQTRPFDQRRFDTVLVVGDLAISGVSPAVVAFLQRAARRSRRIGSTCTGAFNLAQAGILDARRATTHWLFASQMRRQYPQVALEEDRIFVVDGSVWTSAGMSACIDLALALVQADLGADIARQASRKMVVYHRRAGGQSQFSALLELEPRSDRIQSVLTHAKENLHTDLSVERLAKVAHLSPRQFTRTFRAETGQSPAKAVERLRVEAAKLMLEDGRRPINIIARDAGFGDRERMRRAFLRNLGQPPQGIRRTVARR